MSRNASTHLEEKLTVHHLTDHAMGVPLFLRCMTVQKEILTKGKFDEFI